MSRSAAIVDSPLRQAAMRFNGMPAGELTPRDLNVLFQVRLGPSGLRAPVSHGDFVVSSRTIINNAR